MSKCIKPYLSYNEQFKKLNEKGISCNTPEEKTIIVRKGYFNIINGYEVFL